MKRVQLSILLAAFLGARAYGEFTLGSQVDIVDSAYYAGSVSDGSNVSGRIIMWGAPSPDGTKIAFLGANLTSLSMAIFLVNVGDPSSWTRLTSDTGFSPRPLCWSPDGTAILMAGFRVPLSSGNFINNPIQGYTGGDVSSTYLPSDNWLAVRQSFTNIVLLPILTDGRPDSSRTPVSVTNWSVETSWPSISADGTEITFSNFTNSSPADLSDVYVLKNVDQILAAPKTGVFSNLAPTSLADLNIVGIRTSETNNFAHGMSHSPDKSLVLYAEDVNNAFNDGDFFGTLALADFDVMISNADGSGPDVRIPASGNQSGPRSFPNGIRLLYSSDVGGALHGFVVTIQVSAAVSGTTVGNPADNDIVTSADQQGSDGSGTSFEIPASTTIDFPIGEPQEISILTPLDPVSEAQLPPGVAGIPVVRDFGPDGTQFAPPIAITITYTDAEVAGLDEASVTPYLYNSLSDAFDTPVPEGDIVSRDLDNNRITFLVDHFSQFGLGFEGAFPAPIETESVAILALALGFAASIALVRRRQNR